MLEQHAPHVFALSTSPHRQRPPPAQQPPRSILKKPSSEPSTPSHSTPTSPRRMTSPLTSPRSDTFSVSSYHSQHWTVAGIAKAQQQQLSSPSASAHTTSLTVTLLYLPTETLYAWPFNLSSPGTKGVCYETYSASRDNGEPRRPPEGTMSVSLRVLADVIRCWMRIRRDRAALAKRRGSDNGSTFSTNSSPTSSVDDIVDNDEVMDEIIDTLNLHPLAPLERSIHVLRQVLPEHSGYPTQPDDGGSARQRELDSSPADSDRDSHHRSDSSASSRASTVEPGVEDAPATQSSSPKLPKINTALPRSSSSQSPPPVPQIRLVEATPQETDYTERDRALEKARPANSRKGSFNSRSMDTVHEDATEDNDTKDSASNEATSTFDSEEVTFIKIHPCDRQQAEQGPTSPTSPKTATSVASSPGEASTVKSKRMLSSSPSKVSFRDPFKNVQRSSSKPDIRVETIEYGSPDSLMASSNNGVVDKSSKTRSTRRPSFEGLRAMFGSNRSKSQ